MKLIFISDNGSLHKKINLNLINLTILLLSFLLLVGLISGIFSYFQKDTISSTEIRLLNKFDSMLMKTAELDGQIKRLNTLGNMIAKNNNIDIQAYLLSEAPAMGGIGKTSTGRSSILSKENLSENINNLELELELQEQRYSILKKMSKAKLDSKTASAITVEQIPDELIGYTMPVSKGYISSSFGTRRDPFNGHKRHHNGIDIAGKHGSKIHAIASGFVTFVGRKGGYGNVIDIRHSDTLKSRYAHLHKMKIKKGDVVRKGHIIGTMGKTGRATGPHLHLEVWKKDRPVNPKSFIGNAIIN